MPERHVDEHCSAEPGAAEPGTDEPGADEPGAAEPLSTEDVRHVARLARLSLSAEQIESYRSQLSSVLDHLAKLGELDLQGATAAAAATPHECAPNRLAADTVEPPLPLADLLRNAPAIEGPFLAVPKVLDTDG